MGLKSVTNDISSHGCKVDMPDGWVELSSFRCLMLVSVNSRLFLIHTWLSPFIGGWCHQGLQRLGAVPKTFPLILFAVTLGLWELKVVQPLHNILHFHRSCHHAPSTIAFLGTFPMSLPSLINRLGMVGLLLGFQVRGAFIVEALIWVPSLNHFPEEVMEWVLHIHLHPSCSQAWETRVHLIKLQCSISQTLLAIRWCQIRSSNLNRSRHITSSIVSSHGNSFLFLVVSSCSNNNINRFVEGWPIWFLLKWSLGWVMTEMRSSSSCSH